MRKRIILLIVLAAFSHASQAASKRILWGNADLTKYAVKSGDYQLKPVENETELHPISQRYQLYYKHIPIWGYQLIVHKKKHGADFITGVEVNGIERDVPEIKAGLSAAIVEQTIRRLVKETVLYKNNELIIYLDSQNKARLAYHLSFYTSDAQQGPASPNYIVDANTGRVLKQWDNLPHNKIGQGLGGNTVDLSYRKGKFQYGSSQPNLPSLGKFDVNVKGGRCYLETPEIKVINTDDTDLTADSLPLLSAIELIKKPPTFSYPCNEKSQYINLNDGGSAPSHYSFSAVNDTMYFAGVTLDMYRNRYGIAQPLGKDLPLRAYVHIKKLDNATAISTLKMGKIHIFHQQLIIGDGDALYTALTQSVVVHELSHNVTSLLSGLVNEGQTGGVNESFSDMAIIAMQDYLRKDYPWYWNGVDWSIGSEVTLGSMPMRFMDEPRKDGRSIDHAADYVKGMNPHLSSGVFNKAFYLLAHKKNWSVQKAFQVMVDANKNYWTSKTSFKQAACGVIQAAKDRAYATQPVIEAFSEVGVVCQLKLGSVNISLA